MGTAIAIISVCFILNGQAGRALKGATDWLKENFPDLEENKNPH